MKRVFAFIFFLYPFCASSIESCSLEAIGLTNESSQAEKLFYVGTCHYRNKQYVDSVPLWSELSKLENIEPKYIELQISALNNLGYMYFFGYGIEENKLQALTYWNQAIALGHTEAEFHLCHAYADSEVSTYDPIKALPHCQKAKLIYQGMENKNSDEMTILKQIKKYIKQLNQRNA